ncbi:hypothetical protein RRG08_003623 [Elysia crispata]|uniref:Uncharacterized protein n=1 Tax=Elysia crispata TaxID=231223 RepID=A0AAE1AVD7_9GAST|nr:hypothetical protein RRG08_003623 [Elysia crispata]
MHTSRRRQSVWAWPSGLAGTYPSSDFVYDYTEASELLFRGGKSIRVTTFAFLYLRFRFDDPGLVRLDLPQPRMCRFNTLTEKTGGPVDSPAKRGRSTEQNFQDDVHRTDQQHHNYTCIKHELDLTAAASYSSELLHFTVTEPDGCLREANMSSTTSMPCTG